MQIIVCDICKKKMDNPITDRTFYYIGNHSVCEQCKENFDHSIKPTVRNKEPFTMDWYHKLVSDSLDKASQKGKV